MYTQQERYSVISAVTNGGYQKNEIGKNTNVKL